MGLPGRSSGKADCRRRHLECWRHLGFWDGLRELCMCGVRAEEAEASAESLSAYRSQTVRFFFFFFFWRESTLQQIIILFWISELSLFRSTLPPLTDFVLTTRPSHKQGRDFSGLSHPLPPKKELHMMESGRVKGKAQRCGVVISGRAQVHSRWSRVKCTQILRQTGVLKTKRTLHMFCLVLALLCTSCELMLWGHLFRGGLCDL